VENIIFEVNKQIAVVKVDRPKQLNALNRKTLEELNTVIDMIEADKSLKGVIITGNGEKAFVAGADITELAQVDGTGGYAFPVLVREFLIAWKH
jgi:enoyl-CoA hydratase